MVLFFSDFCRSFVLKVNEKRKKIRKNISTTYIKRSTFTCSILYIMATNAKSTTASSSTRPWRLLNARMIQNFHLVWLDGSIDETNDDYHKSITKLRQVVNTVYTFVNVDECIDFITDINEKCFVIISEEFSPPIISIVQDIFPLSCVYIFRKNNVPHEKVV